MTKICKCCGQSRQSKYPIICSLGDYFNPRNLRTVKKCNDIYHKANEYYRKEKYEKAIKQYEKFIDLHICDRNVFMELGSLYFKVGKLHDSIRTFKKAKGLADRADVKLKLAEVCLTKATKTTSNKFRRECRQEAASNLSSLDHPMYEAEVRKKYNDLKIILRKVKR